MNPRRVTRRILTTSAFGAAAAFFALGLAGRLGPWLAVLVLSLALLTIGFYFASPESRRE